MANTYSTLAQASVDTFDAPSGDLARIVLRISGLLASANEIGLRLETNADKVYGGCPEKAGSASACAPVRAGLIGEIEDALDRLFAALEFASKQVGRNCTLT